MSASDPTETGSVRLEIKPRSGFFAPDDDRAKEEAHELLESLERELPDEVQKRPGDRQKGFVTDVVIPLASSGAMTAMAEVFKAWLSKRPEDRSIDIDFEVDESETGRRTGNISVDAKNVDSAVFDTIAREVLRPGK